MPHNSRKLILVIQNILTPLVDVTLLTSVSGCPPSPIYARSLRVLAGSLPLHVHPQLGVPSLPRVAILPSAFAVLRSACADASVHRFLLLLRDKVCAEGILGNFVVVRPLL